MATDVFEFKINGEGVRPDTLDLTALLKVLHHLDGAVHGVPVDQELSLSLIQITDGSGRYFIRASHGAIAALALLTSAISTGDFSDLSAASRHHLRQMWKATANAGWDGCEFIGSSIKHAEIVPSQELFPSEMGYSGVTTIYGKCIRVGGDGKSTATMTLLDGTRITVSLASQELAQELGRRLFQTVGLEGDALWHLETNELLEFKAQSLSEFRDRSEGEDRPRTVKETFVELAAISGDRWSNIDPDEFVRMQRYD